MIIINDELMAASELASDYPEDSLERIVLGRLSDSEETYTYTSSDALKFELQLRREIVRAADALQKSGLDFEVFRQSRCNQEYWKRGGDGGFELKKDVMPSEAIGDIFKHGSKYGTECATAMQIIYLKALMEVFPKEQFDMLFGELYLMNWHRIHRYLRQTGVMQKVSDYLPGDRRYFANPDVDPETPEWQGENVIDMGDGTFYGHGMGRHKSEAIIKALNKNRRKDAEKEAYLMNTVGRPNFKNLFKLYKSATTDITRPRSVAV